MKYGRTIYILYLSCFAFIFSSCENDIETVNLITSYENLPVESTENAELLYSDSAMVKVKITAPIMNRYIGEKPYIELPEGIHVLFYDDSMKVESELTAEYAIRYEGEQKMEAKRNVVLTNVKDETLKTEHLIWDEKGKKLYSYEFVTIKTADEVIIGKNGFEADQNFTNYTIYGGKGEFKMDEE